MKQQQQPNTTIVERRDTGGRRCKVIFSYIPQHEDELSLCEGDIVNVLEEVEEGWWKGILKGKIGMFPSNFVEDCNQGEDSRSNIYSMEPRNTEINGNPQMNDSTLNGKRDTNGIQPSPNSAFHPPVHYATVNKDAKVEKNAIEKERSEEAVNREKITINNGDRKSHTNELMTKIPASNTVSQPSPPQLPPKPVREMARVLFPYTADHEDELELIEGDLITLLSKDLEDKGWWKGEIGGKVGVFPDNFVQIISQEEIMKPPRPEKRPPASITKAIRTSSSSSVSSITKEKEPSLPPSFLPPPIPGKKGSPPPVPNVKNPLSPPDNFPKASNDYPMASYDSPRVSYDSPKVSYDSPKASNDSEINPSEPNSLTLSRETHLTHVMRPKGPSNRRPPSHILKENKNSIITDDIVSEEDSSMMKTNSFSEETKNESENAVNGSTKAANLGSTNQQPPWFKELKSNQKKRLSVDRFSQSDSDSTVRVSSPGRLSPPPTAKIVPKPEIPVKAASTNNLPPTAITPSAANASTSPNKIPNTAPRELQKSLVNGLDSSLSSKIDSIYLEITTKVRSLETRLDDQNTKHVSQMQQLTHELDEERMARACLQIEVDRLKKLMNAQYAHV